MNLLLTPQRINLFHTNQGISAVAWMPTSDRSPKVIKIKKQDIHKSGSTNSFGVTNVRQKKEAILRVQDKTHFNLMQE